jgi:hypothetical protein
VVAKATADAGVTTVQLRASLRAAVMTNADSVRSEVCGMLASLQGGKAGAAAAAEGERATGAGTAPTVMNAQMLADRLSKERDQNVNEIPLRYKGRSFTLQGVVSSVIRDGDKQRDLRHPAVGEEGHPRTR